MTRNIDAVHSVGAYLVVLADKCFLEAFLFPQFSLHLCILHGNGTRSISSDHYTWFTSLHEIFNKQRKAPINDMRGIDLDI